MIQYYTTSNFHLLKFYLPILVRIWFVQPLVIRDYNLRNRESKILLVRKQWSYLNFAKHMLECLQHEVTQWRSNTACGWQFSTEIISLVGMCGFTYTFRSVCISIHLGARKLPLNTSFLWFARIYSEKSGNEWFNYRIVVRPFRLIIFTLVVYGSHDVIFGRCNERFSLRVTRQVISCKLYRIISPKSSCFILPSKMDFARIMCFVKICWRWLKGILSSSTLPWSFRIWFLLLLVSLRARFSYAFLCVCFFCWIWIFTFLCEAPNEKRSDTFTSSFEVINRANCSALTIPL